MNDRQWNMMEETFIINQIKESCCFTSLDFLRDLKMAKETPALEQTYVLPDFASNQRGYVLNSKASCDSQVIQMNNERL